MDTGAGDTIYRFGAFELLARRQILIHAGSPVAIGSRAVAILCHLVERAGSLVSKSDLIDAAWPNTFVHSDNLKVNIAGLRRVLAARDPRQDYIVAVPGRGYRFIVPVRRDVAAKVTYTSAVRCVGLPAAVSLIGRSEEVEAICLELKAFGFLTITGTGGVGKTAVSVAAAHRIADEFAGGACFVDLASVSDPRHLPATISAELGVRSDSDDLLGAVIHALANENRLLVLDNCEHLLPAIAAAADRLAAALPHIKILATSREPLGLLRERVLRVAPLACPLAVELFLRRARDATGEEVWPADLAAVTEICVQLDGIPLALELAAARCGAYTPVEFLRLLVDRFDLLQREGGTGPTRRHALRATLEWSYSLLRPREAALLRALAVFARAFTAEDALAIARATDVLPAEALESLAGLISKSLLSLDGREDGVHYRLLESTKAFAAERLQADRHRHRIEQRHAEHVCVSLERAESEWERAVVGEERIGPSRWAADVRRALFWALGDHGATPLGIRLTISAIPMWNILSLHDESIAYLALAIEMGRRAGAGVSANEVRLQITLATALLYSRGPTAETEIAWQEAKRLAEQVGSTDLLIRALWGYAAYELHAGRPATTAKLVGRFGALCRTLADQSAAPDGDRLLAVAEMYLGRLTSAAARLENLQLLGEHSMRPRAYPPFQVHRDVSVDGTLSMLKWLMGDQLEAARLAEATAMRAIAKGHAVSACNVLGGACLPIALLDGRLADAQRFLSLLQEQFSGRRLTLWAQKARCPEAALAVRQGNPDGLALLEQAITHLVAVGATIRLPAYAGMLAEAFAQAERLAEANRWIEDALARASVQQERWIMPELSRIRAGIWAREGKLEPAENMLGAAIGSARDIGAEAWRRRACADLAKLRAAKADTGEQRLAPPPAAA